MGRSKNPFLYPFSANKPIEITVDREEGKPHAGAYEGSYTSERALTEIEAQLIGVRVAKILHRYGVTELHLSLGTDNVPEA